MVETTARLSLPLIAAGQAQKEIAHNEALILADCLLQPVVEGVGPAQVPLNPGLGASWIIGATPLGAWAGKAGFVALWTAGGWRFLPPREGMSFWSVADALWVQRRAGAWILGASNAQSLRVDGVQVVGARQPAISALAGGAVIDAEARIAITAMLGALRTHGLIAL
jgi:Protein of unknown function (DUF2793)